MLPSRALIGNLKKKPPHSTREDPLKTLEDPLNSKPSTHLIKDPSTKPTSPPPPHPSPLDFWGACRNLGDGCKAIGDVGELQAASGIQVASFLTSAEAFRVESCSLFFFFFFWGGGVQVDS